MMTTKFKVQSPGPGQLNGDPPIRVCDACGHTQLSHDAISTRFCQASRDRALERDCICPTDPSIGETEWEDTGSAARRSGAPMYGRGRFSGR